MGPVDPLMRWLTVRRVGFVVSLALLCLWAFQGMSGQTGVPIGTQIDELRAELDDGRVYRLGADAQQVLVLNFWATWCAPCRKEAPILSSVQRPGVEVIGVVIEDLPLVTASAKARAIGARYPIAVDRTGLMRRFGVQVVPTTYVIAGDGRVVFGRSGLVGRAELQDAIAEAQSSH